MHPLLRVCVAFIATYGAGLVAYLFVDSRIGSWYEGLVKPALTPPDETFVFVWLVLYALMALSLGIVWTKNTSKNEHEGWVRFYFVQLLFNAAWTIFFFGFHAVILSFVVILFLGFMVLALIANAAEIDRRVVYLLLPYLAWIIFGGYLTLSIWWLN